MRNTGIALFVKQETRTTTLVIGSMTIKPLELNSFS
jgi:hypothetical protein